MDTLQELSEEQWPLLLEKLQALWPLNVGGYYALQTSIRHPAIRDAFSFQVFCPYGDMDNGFVALSVKESAELLIFSTKEDTSKLEDALANTKVIDWNTKACIDMATSLTIKLMEKLKTRMGFQTFDVWKAETMFLDKTSKRFEDVRCPPDTFLAAVNPDHIKQVDDAWPYRYPNSHAYFALFISNGRSYGLYSLDKKLLAWVFLNEYNFLCHLYCEKSHRRKGFAEFLIKTVVNDCLGRGDDVYGFVVPGNQRAMELFTKLGFRHVDTGAWMNVGRCPSDYSKSD